MPVVVVAFQLLKLKEPKHLTQAVVEEDRIKWPELATLTGLPLAKIERLFTNKTRTVRTEDATSKQGGAASAKVVFSVQQTEPVVTDEDDAADGPEEVLDDADGPTQERSIRWAKIREDIDETTYDKITALKIKGVYGNRVFRRVYPHNSLAAHLVGYVNKAGVAAAGVAAVKLRRFPIVHALHERGVGPELADAGGQWHRELAALRSALVFLGKAAVENGPHDQRVGAVVAHGLVRVASAKLSTQ